MLNLRQDMRHIWQVYTDLLAEIPVIITIAYVNHVAVAQLNRGLCKA